MVEKEKDNWLRKRGRRIGEEAKKKETRKTREGEWRDGKIGGKGKKMKDEVNRILLAKKGN